MPLLSPAPREIVEWNPDRRRSSGALVFDEFDGKAVMVMAVAGLGVLMVSVPEGQTCADAEKRTGVSVFTEEEVQFDEPAVAIARQFERR